MEKETREITTSKENVRHFKKERWDPSPIRYLKRMADQSPHPEDTKGSATEYYYEDDTCW
jgi:hypothetical protein